MFFARKYTLELLRRKLAKQLPEFEHGTSPGHAVLFALGEPVAFFGLSDDRRNVTMLYAADLHPHFAADLALRINEFLPIQINTEQLYQTTAAPQTSAALH